MSSPNDEYDPCECLINPEALMRRLLNVLRQSQHEEFTHGGEYIPPSTFSTSSNNNNGNFQQMALMALLFSAFAIIMFFTRPPSLRRINSDEKPPRVEILNDHQRQPPPSLG